MSKKRNGETGKYKQKFKDRLNKVIRVTKTEKELIKKKRKEEDAKK